MCLRFTLGAVDEEDGENQFFFSSFLQICHSGDQSRSICGSVFSVYFVAFVKRCPWSLRKHVILFISPHDNAPAQTSRIDCNAVRRRSKLKVVWSMKVYLRGLRFLTAHILCRVFMIGKHRWGLLCLDVIIVEFLQFKGLSLSFSLQFLFYWADACVSLCYFSQFFVSIRFWLCNPN